MSQTINADATVLEQLREEVKSFLSYRTHESLLETDLWADYIRELYANARSDEHQRIHDPRKAERELLCEQSDALDSTICELLFDPSSSDETIFAACAKHADLQRQIKQMLP